MGELMAGSPRAPTPLLAHTHAHSHIVAPSTRRLRGQIRALWVKGFQPYGIFVKIPDINLVRVSLIPSTREKENVRGFPKIHNCKEEEDKTKKTRKRMANKPEKIGGSSILSSSLPIVEAAFNPDSFSWPDSRPRIPVIPSHHPLKHLLITDVFLY